MNKLFYRPGTLKVIGISDGEDSILLPNGKPFPYIETDEPHESLPNLIIKLDKDKKPVLYYKKGSLNDPDPVPAEEPVKEPEEIPVEDIQSADAVLIDEQSIK